MASGQLPYRVSFAGRHFELVRQWLDRCQTTGERLTVVDLVLQLRQGLESDPHQWGDPIRDLHHLGLAMYRQLFGNVIVSYAVDDTLRVVYLAELRLSQWHPLYRDDSR